MRLDQSVAGWAVFFKSVASGGRRGIGWSWWCIFVLVYRQYDDLLFLLRDVLLAVFFPQWRGFV